MPAKLFRSLIDVDGKIEQDALLRNYSYLAQSAVSIADPDYISIWEYLQEYALDYSAMPSIETVRDHFTRQKDMTVLDRLEELERIKKTYKFTDFENLVSVMVKQQKDQEMMVLLKTAADILNDGLKIRQGRENVEYKGHRGSMQYLMEHAEDMLASERGFRTKSNLVQDTEEARTEFHSVLAAKEQTYGIITGLSNIDDVVRGIKPGDLWIHAGFTGELKTTFALNWMYRAVFLLQCNVYYLSLEMTLEHIRRIIFAMHANHPKWQGQGRPRLSYKLIRDGEDENGPMTPEQIQFYEDIIDDIEKFRGVSYGDFIVRSPDEDYDVFKLKADLEIQHNSTPLHMCVVDHFALMKPTTSTRNYYTDLNSIIRDTKRLALTFNHGEQIPILGLLQINRQGKDDATKADGVYKMQALADANEAERSSNIITTSYLDAERRANGQVKFGCLKNRDGQHFTPFEGRIDWGTRYFRNGGFSGDLEAGMEAETQAELIQSIEMSG